MHRVALISGTMDGVYEIAAQVSQWLATGRDVRVATVVATRGFSSGSPAATAAWTADAPAIGSLGDAIALNEVDGDGLVDVTVAQEDAMRAGLACGGTA